MTLQGGFWIGLTVTFNVVGTFVARQYAQDNRLPLLAVALLSYTLAFVTWSRVLRYCGLGFASSVTTGSILLISNIIAFTLFREHYPPAKLFFTGLILVGVVGVNLSGS